jgi:F0F1-type ATP synthase membrane subunit b/b'
MNIIPDPLQVVLNMLPFLVAIVGMYLIILKPMVAYLLERKVAIQSGHDEAARIEAEINTRMSQYEQQLGQAREEVVALRAAKRAEAQVKYDEVIAVARTEAEAQIASAVGEIGVAHKAASTQLKVMSGEIADKIANQVLGRTLTVGA